MTTHDDRVGPSRDQARHVLDDDGLAKHNTAQDVADRAVRRFPHLLEVELFYSVLVRCDGRALHAHAIFGDGVGRVDGDLVVGFVALFDAEIVIMQVDVEIGLDQALADPFPDNPRHFVAVDFDDRVFHLDLGHACFLGE